MQKEIILFANWGLGKKVLIKLLEEGFSIKAVVTQFDSAKEEEDPYYNLVYKTAKEHNIKTFKNFKELLEFLDKEKTQYDKYLGVSVAFNKIIPKSILSKFDIINLHPSLIPPYRGVSPIEHQIKNKEKFIGLTIHFVTPIINWGEIIAQEKFLINYNKKFSEFLEEFNEFSSEFLVKKIKNLKSRDVYSVPTHYIEKINKKLKIPKTLYNKSLKEIAEYLNRPRLAIFTGNRAEFGILYPLIVEASKSFQLDLYVSGTHTLNEWNTIQEIREKIKYLPVNLIEIKLKDNNYELSFSYIYEKLFKLFNKMEKYNFAICLGDRIETFAFAVASFYSKIPIIHVAAGDTENSPYFDANVRHAISKISSIFFTTNEKSKNFLLQLGEEEWRIFNIGHLSLCYDKLNLIVKPSEIKGRFDITNRDIILLVTIHPSHIKSSIENFKDFLQVYKAISKILKENFNVKAILTYPNNDPNNEKILQFLKELKNKTNSKLFIENSLGTDTIISLFKNFKTIVVGNSSLGLMETAYYGIPTLNLGDRQIDRLKGINVIDLPMDEKLIYENLSKIITMYDFYRRKNLNDPRRFIYGDGTGCKKAIDFIKELIEKYSTEELVFKKTVVRTCK